MVSGILYRTYVFYLFSRDAGWRRHEGAVASQNSSGDTVRGAFVCLPPPPPLDIHDLNAAGNWKESEQARKNYSIAMKLHQKPEAVHTASNIACPSRTEARNVFATFTNWASNTDQNKIQPVL